MNHMQFASRDEFRGWLKDHCMSSDGVWLLFGKSGRRKNSKWSDKNKAIIQRLGEQGIMTDYGRAKIMEHTDGLGMD